jgi:hypothetical protein
MCQEESVGVLTQDRGALIRRWLPGGSEFQLHFRRREKQPLWRKMRTAARVWSSCRNYTNRDEEHREYVGERRCDTTIVKRCGLWIRVRDTFKWCNILFYFSTMANDWCVATGVPMSLEQMQVYLREQYEVPIALRLQGTTMVNCRYCDNLHDHGLQPGHHVALCTLQRSRTGSVY